MERRWIPLVLGCLLVLCAVFQTSHSEESVGSLEDVVFSSDQARLRQVLANAEPYDTLEEAYLVAKGVHKLNDDPSNGNLVQNACKYVLAQKMETMEDIFHVVSVGILYKEICKVSSNAPLRGKVAEVLKGTPDMKTLYYAITAAIDLKIETDNEALLAAVVETVEKEDTPQSYAYAFLAASVIPNVDLSHVFESVEDIVAQADETPSTLYFDGGLGVTADVVSGIFALADRVNAAPAITEAQATKFGNFLVTSKYTSSLTDAVHLLTAARALSGNKYVVPTAITLPNSRPISSSNPDLDVQLTTLMGGVVEGFTPKVKSLEDPEGEVNPRTRTMTAGNDKITFSYPMFKDTTGPGQYKVTISTGAVEKSPSPVVELSGVELSVMVSFQVAIGSAQLSIVDKDQGVTTKSASLEYPNTSSTTMQADQHSKVVMVFTLTNKEKSNPITVHQAFVRLSLGKEEIFFVATPNAEKQYSFELDVAESAKDFGQLSGTYLLSLMVGDFALENPFSWDVASVELKFPGTPGSREENMAYKPKKLIEHMFRVPEKRPPKVVSTAFTVLVFIPLALLVIIWLAMGANFSNISTGGIWAILFHTGLGAILCLYYCFWAQLNMFSTLKYLFCIGVFTFLTGNRMLRNIAKARES